ncbi:MAG: peptide-binding protein [Desulfobacteraceae bacterium 4572_35.1]|nr:MAG: peptide-binding protein [Desulfobacteraceae bacterium 4572_35.1]
MVMCLLFGCNQQDDYCFEEGQAHTPEVGDTIIMGTIADASNLLPMLSTDSASSQVAGQVYNGLVRYDKDLNFEGDLAQSWEVSPDGLEIVFHLRHGVKWHDGVPFTSADVLFTYKLLVDPDTPTAYSERYKQVSQALAPDPYTFIVRYKKPLASALISWGMAIHPEHLLAGKDIAQSPLARAPIGTGPYRFVEWLPGEKIVLERNPDYFEGAPYIKRIVYRIIPDMTTMFLELQSGGLDQMGLSPLQYARQTDSPAFRRRFNRYRYPAFAYTYLGYNLKRPLFQDKRVRQAMSYAINKQELVDGVLMGLGQPANGPYKPDSWPYNANVNSYPYSPQKAKQLLSAAGWVDADGDDVRDKNGRPFEFTIVTNQGNDQRIKSAEIIQRRFQQVGIKVKIRVIEWASLLKEFIHPGNFDATLMGWTIPIDPDGYNVWHSSKTGPGQLNFVGYKNKRVDELLERGRRIMDQDERKKMYDEFQQILADEQPYTFLFVPDALPVVAKRFHGVEEAPSGIMHNFIRWYVPVNEQKYQR